MLEHAMRGTTLEIWGDGENVRDFVYIDDMADVCMRFIDQEMDNGIYNVCSGERYTINQLCDIVRQACETDLKIIFKARRDVDARVVALDCAHLAAKLQWKPKTTLEDGIRLTWQWLKNQKN
jgi:UDP-glucose 4-epimerase